MENFWFNVEYGVNHVLDPNGYDHVLFLIILAVPYLFKDWKKVLVLVSLFTIGHTFSLFLAAYNIINLNGELVEFLIPITILIGAIYNILTASKVKAKTNGFNLITVVTLFFGIIHGLGFAREFKMLAGLSENKLILLVEFALGIEIAQVIVVFVAMFSGFLIQTVFKRSRRDWVLVVSSIVIGLILPIISESDFLN